jgi:hypothetical protein
VVRVECVLRVGVGACWVCVLRVGCACCVLGVRGACWVRVAQRIACSVLRVLCVACAAYRATDILLVLLKCAPFAGEIRANEVGSICLTCGLLLCFCPCFLWQRRWL